MGHAGQPIPMSTVEEIESAITQLPPEEYSRVRDWFINRDNSLWDKQIEEDSASGRLDHIVQELEQDISAGKVKPLDEVINHPSGSR